MKRLKVQLLVDKSWEHFSYVSEETVLKIGGMDKLRYFIARVWCREFNLLQIDTYRDMRVLKSRIKAFYKARYAEIYSETETDSQGWVRWWITEKVEEALSDGTV